MTVSVEERLAAIEALLPHLATKEDLQKLKVWWLGGIIAGMAVAAGIAGAMVRFFV